MKKLIILTAMLAITATTLAQKKDSIAQKHDTTYVPLLEKSDTTKATLLYLGGNGNVKHLEGYVVMKGLVRLDQGKAHWATQPQPSEYLDDRKRHMKEKVIQAF